MGVISRKNVARPCRIAAGRLRRDAGRTGHNARERDTGEPRGRVVQHLPDRGQAATRPRRDAGSCGHIAATSAHERVGVGNEGTLDDGHAAFRNQSRSSASGAS